MIEPIIKESVLPGIKNKIQSTADEVLKISKCDKPIMDPAYDIESILLSNETIKSIRSIMIENATVNDIKQVILCYYDISDEKLFKIIENDVS